MRKQRPVFTEVARVAQATDRVTVDYDGTVEGKPFDGSDGRDVTFVLGAGQVLADFDAAATGATAGETRTVTLTYAENHSSKELAGKTAEFKLAIKKIEEQTLPPLDEEFCRAYGVEDGGVEALKTEVRASMERELEGVIRNRVRVQIMDQLYKNNPLELPRSLVEEATQQLQFDMGRRMGVREAAQLPPRENFTEAARQRVALGLIIGEIIRNLDVQLDNARVQARLDDVAAGYPNPEEVRRQYLQNPDALRQVQSSVLEDQAIDAIMAKARITDKPATFKEITGFGGAEQSA
jgi:trigger factor